MSEFDDIFRNQVRDRANVETARVGTAVTLHNTQPDQVAKSRKIGQTLGYPTGVVEAAPELFQQRVDQQQAVRLLADAPQTTRWMQDFENQQLARDDLPNLTWWERFGNTQFGKGLRTGGTGFKQIGTAVGTIPSASIRNRSREQLELFDKVREMEPETARHEMASALGIDPMSDAASLAHGFLVADDDGRKKMIARSARLVASSEETMKPIIAKVLEYSEHMKKTQGRMPNFTDISDAEDFGDWLAFSTGQAIPFLAAIMVAGALGGTPAIVGGGYAMGVGDIQSQLIDEGITDKPEIAVLGGAPYAALEALGPAARMFRGVSGDMLQQVAEGYFRRLGKEIPKSAIEEFINEAGQEIVADISVAQGGGAPVELNDETLLRWFNAGMAGMAPGASMAPITAIQRKDAAAHAKAGTTAEQLGQVDEMASSSKLRERASEKFQEHLEAAGLGDSHIQIPAAEVQTFYQSELSDETLAQLGVERTDFEAMLATGGDISVPMANYATHFAGTDTAAMFAEHGVFDDTEMSVAEARAYEEGVGQEVVTALEADMAANREQVTDIRESMRQQLTAAGRTTRVADTEALVFSSLWETLARKKGAAADALASRFGLEVRGMSDILPGGAADRVAAGIDPAASEPSPPTPETVFQQPAAKDMEIEVEMDDGATETLPAGQVYEAYQARQNDAQSLLNCLINA